MPSTSFLAGEKVRKAASMDPPRLNVVAAFIAIVCWAVGIGVTAWTADPWPVVVAVVLGLVLSQSPKVANQWSRGVVLRLGRYVGLRGPGLFWPRRSLTRFRRGSISGSSPRASRPRKRSRRTPYP